MIEDEPAATVSASLGGSLNLSVAASGTGPLEFAWLHNGSEIPGADSPTLNLSGVSRENAGHYRALIRNREGTAISRDVLVVVGP
jgi:hypothetical protein